jgi:hypothetical protein
MLLQPDHVNAIIFGIIQTVINLNIADFASARDAPVVLILDKEGSALPPQSLFQISPHVYRQSLFRCGITVSRPEGFEGMPRRITQAKLNSLRLCVIRDCLSGSYDAKD